MLVFKIAIGCLVIWAMGETVWTLDGAALSAVDSIVSEAVKESVGPEFMAPPTGLA